MGNESKKGEEELLRDPSPACLSDEAARWARMAVDIDTGIIIDIGDISTDSEDEEEAADQSGEKAVATYPGDADSEDADEEAGNSDATEEESTVEIKEEEPDQSEETTVAIYPICLGGGRQHMLRQHMAECMANTLQDPQAWPFTWAEVPREAGEEEEGEVHGSGESE